MIAVSIATRQLVYPGFAGFRVYWAPDWRAAARKVKNNTRIPKETGYILMLIQSPGL
jgi:hypothetical protein